MSRRRRTPLTPEDRALWREAMRGARPLPPELRGPPGPPDRATGDPPAGNPPAGNPPARAPERPAAGRAEPPARWFRPAPPSDAPRITVDRAPPALAEPRGGIDARTLQRIKRGQMEPEASLDLHGMSAERAHPALQRFVGQALDQGLRLVLVITGKGGARTGPGPDAPFMLPPPGLLRRQSPRWLKAGPYARQIVGLFPAHARHGGAGAMYVYLKKRR